MFYDEVKEQLLTTIIPFWRSMRDNQFGGYYGFYSYDLQLEEKASKGCILNSRILWFFSSAYTLLREETLRNEADHAYSFLKEACYDRKNGGLYWMVSYKGMPEDTDKYTYNQAFAIFALVAYYEATKQEEARSLAMELYELIEHKCKDHFGYLEAFDEQFKPISNEKLSENGVVAEKTMNTLLHVFEAYTGLYKVSKEQRVKKSLKWILSIFEEKVYNKEKRRQEVFFDREWNSLIDLHSYGHDIEASWLIEEGCKLIEESELTERMLDITKALRAKIYERAYVNHSLLNECENGIDNTMRIWWVQAEAVVGFLSGSIVEPEKKEYRRAAKDIWNFIKNYIIDTRKHSEWYWQVYEDGTPDKQKPIVEPWKCPYHNGRMCLEIMRLSVKEDVRYDS